MLLLAPIMHLLVSTPVKPPQYFVEKRISISGDGGWDLLTVESSRHRLFVSRGSHVQVVDVETNKVVGDIPKTAGVHDISIDEKSGHGYISSGKDNVVVVFDLKTLAEIKRIPVGKKPDAMAKDHFSSRLFVFNAGSEDATVIDLKNDSVAGTISLGGKPELAASDEKGHLFVNLEDKSSVVQVDTKTLKVLNTWPLAPGEEPTGIGYDPKTGTVFSACANKMMTLLDSKSGKVTTTVPIGEGPDGAGFDPMMNVGFSPNGGDGTLTIIGSIVPGKWQALQTLETAKGARNLALDTKTHKVYLMSAKYMPKAEGERRPKMVPGSAEVIVVSPRK